MDYQIAESIMGHWFKGKSVNDRYGRISDQELIQAIDSMTFDHGESEIFVAQKPRTHHPETQKTPSCLSQLGVFIILFGGPSGARTPNLLIKSQLLYQLS
jgi:hypothetical protein